MTRDNLFNTNASIVANLAKAATEVCPTEIYRVLKPCLDILSSSVIGDISNTLPANQAGDQRGELESFSQTEKPLLARIKRRQRINADFDHFRLEYLLNNVQVGNKNHCVYYQDIKQSCIKRRSSLQLLSK